MVNDRLGWNVNGKMNWEWLKLKGLKWQNANL